jgi:hypothetical protein
MHYITNHVTSHALCNTKEVRDLTGCHNIYALFHRLFHHLFPHSYTNLRLKFLYTYFAALIARNTNISTSSAPCITQKYFLRKEFLLRRTYKPLKKDDMTASFKKTKAPLLRLDYHKLHSIVYFLFSNAIVLRYIPVK